MTQEDLLKKAGKNATRITQNDQLSAGFAFIENSDLTEYVDDLIRVLDCCESVEDLARLFSNTPNAKPRSEPSFSRADRFKLDRIYRHLEGTLEIPQDRNETLIWRPDESKYGILYLGERVVKSFKRNAGNQIALIEAFDKSDWASRIDNPFMEICNNNFEAATEALRNATDSLTSSAEHIDFGTADGRMKATWMLRD
jgi:hypothetical protein